MKIEFDPETPTAVQESLEVRAILGRTLHGKIESVRLRVVGNATILCFTILEGFDQKSIDYKLLDKVVGKLSGLMVQRFNLSGLVVRTGLH